MNGIRNECWVVTDGTPGMANQCLGIAERLPLPIRTFRICFRPFWQMLAPYSAGSALNHLSSHSDRPKSPWPRLLIACGRQSIPVSRTVKRLSGGKTFTVQCQDPRIDPGSFDLVVPPKHDQLSGPNVCPILGSPNRIEPERLAQARKDFSDLFLPLPAPRIAVLVGGRSHTHGIFGPAEGAILAHQLFALAPHHGLMISTSRRTDARTARLLRETLSGKGSYFWDGTGANPYLGMLAWADAFVVTADSVNMICEAAATGKPVHVVPARGGNRKARQFQQSLLDAGIIRFFSGQIEQWDYPPLNETERVAERIKTLLDLQPDAPDMRP